MQIKVLLIVLHSHGCVDPLAMVIVWIYKARFLNRLFPSYCLDGMLVPPQLLVVRLGHLAENLLAINCWGWNPQATT